MSILRSSQFVRSILSDLRYGAAHPRVFPDSSVALQSKILSVCSSRFISQRRVNDDKSVEKAIQRLDREVRRVGRISRRELVSVFKNIKESGRATSTQSLFMIRCCGNLVPEVMPESRTKLVGEVWETFEKLGVPLDISHYNALLSVYLENEFVFSPNEFLAKLEAKGIEPNRVTYQRLVASCCNRGDIDEATDVLQIMKEKQIPINEAIFNNLITGHAFANDMESAVGILNTMKEAGLEPSTETYSALISGYAKNGDIEGINRTLDECKAKEILIADRDILEAAFVMATNDHLELLDKLFDRLSKTSDSIEDAKNIALRLISQGYASAAIAILRIITPSNAGESQPLQKGNYLIRQAVIANWPVDKIISFCEEMKNLNFNPYSLHVAAESCMVNKKPDMALQLLSALAEKEQLLHHYFWPILVQHGKANNLEGVITALRTMLKTMNQPVSGETLKDYVMPHLKQDAGIEQLREAGIPLATSASAMVGHLLSNLKMEEAAKVSLKYRSNYNNLVNRRALVQAYKETKDLNSLLTLVQVFAEGDEEESEVPGQILLGIIRKEKPEAHVILSKYLEVGIGLTPEHAETIKEYLGESVTPEIEDLLTKLTSPDLVKATPTRRAAPPRRPVVEKDETYILNAIRSVEARGESAAGLKRQLLLYYCHNKELEKAIELKEKLEKEGLEMQPGLLILFMDLYCHHEKLEEALEYYKKAKTIEGSRMDASKVLRLATLLCKNDRYQDAVNILNENLQPQEDTSEFNHNNLTACWKLLNICAEAKNVEATKQIFDTLIGTNYAEPSNIVLGPLIKVHLLRDDLESAMKQFEECCIKYRATPWKNELTCKLIEREDAASLQKIADLSTQIHGEVNSLYDLVLSFVECRKIKQARKILETPGLRTRTQRILAACNRFYSADQVENLKTLVEVTKGFNHIDRSEIFSFLLMSYKKTDDVDKASGLWTQMQEEDVKPSDKFLLELGQLLQKHGRPVPFQLPQSDVIPPLASVKPVASPKIKQFRRALNGRDLDEALQLLKNDINEADLAKADLSRLITLLVNNGRIGEASKMLVSWLERGLRPDVSTLSAIINSIAKIGDVDAIKLIGSQLNTDLRKIVSYSNRYTHCMVEAGRAADVIDELRRTALNAETPEEISEASDLFPRGGIFSVFSTAPELLPQVEEMSEIYRQKGIIEPTNMLWAYFTMTSNTEKAEQYWKLLAPYNRLMFMPILKQARGTMDVNLAESLLARCKAVNLSAPALATIYSAVMDILLSQDKLEECENKLEEALKTCALDDLGRGVLARLKKNVELAGREFKYRLPPRKIRINQSSKQDTSSDSSSDSDNEETKKQSQRA